MHLAWLEGAQCAHCTNHSDSQDAIVIVAAHVRSRWPYLIFFRSPAVDGVNVEGPINPHLVSVHWSVKMPVNMSDTYGGCLNTHDT